MTLSRDEGYDSDFTGEFVVPGKAPEVIWKEHVLRYEHASTLVRAKAVLDVACGTGYGSDLLATAHAMRVVAGEYSTKALSYACRNFSRSNLSFVRLTADHLPFKDDVFDVITSFETVEHLHFRERFLEECRRVIRPHGTLLFSTPSRVTWRPPWAPRPTNPYHVIEFSLDDFRKLLSDHFDEVEMSGQRYVGPTGVLMRYAQYTLQRLLASFPSAQARYRELENRAVARTHTEALAEGGTFLAVKPIGKIFPGFPMYVVAKATKRN